jgi:hypothetical protein
MDTLGVKIEAIELSSVPPPPHAAKAKEAAGIAKIVGDFSSTVPCDAGTVSGAASEFVGPSRAKHSGCVITLPPTIQDQFQILNRPWFTPLYATQTSFYTAYATLYLLNLFLTAYNNFLLRWVG